MQTIKLLGQDVEGKKSDYYYHLMFWEITLGPYTVRIDESLSHTYAYYLRIGDKIILNNQNCVDTIEKAIKAIDSSINKYLQEKKMVEDYYSIP